VAGGSVSDAFPQSQALIADQHAMFPVGVEWAGGLGFARWLTVHPLWIRGTVEFRYKLRHVSLRTLNHAADGRLGPQTGRVGCAPHRDRLWAGSQRLGCSCSREDLRGEGTSVL
jgi:hypothetical protein